MGKRLTKEEKEMEERKEMEKTARRLEIDYPTHPADPYIYQRFRFEPRAKFGHCSLSWIVVYDKLKMAYVKLPGSNRAYITFPNSDDAIKWLREKFTGIKEGK